MISSRIPGLTSAKQIATHTTQMLRNLRLSSFQDQWTSWRHHRRAMRHFPKLRSRYKESRCFVIGNGPSLNNLDLTVLSRELTIGSNGLYLHHSKMGFYPTIYTVTNPFIAEQMGAHIADLSLSIKIFPSFLARYFERAGGEVIFLRTIAGYTFSSDVTQWVSWQSTVTFFNLQIAFSLGCPEVYLIGVDNDYVQQGEGKEGDIIVQNGTADPNHFRSDYFGQGFVWQRADTTNMARCYDLAHEAFNKSGRIIRNATAGGKLEVFPRVDYRTLF